MRWAERWLYRYKHNTYSSLGRILNFDIFCRNLIQRYNIFLLQKDFRILVVIFTFTKIFYTFLVITTVFFCSAEVTLFSIIICYLWGQAPQYMISLSKRLTSSVRIYFTIEVTLIRIEQFQSSWYKLIYSKEIYI